MRRGVLLAMALTVLPPGWTFPARADDQAALAQVMRGLAAVRHSEAAFTEEKAIPELDLPLPSQGTLSWVAPDQLEKRTTTPIEEVLQVAGNRLIYARPDRGIRREFGLDEQPEMRALVEAIRSTLAGDLPALRLYYDIGFEAARGDRHWRMVLTPLSLRVRSAVQRITVGGRGAQVLTVDTEGGGGVTRMQIAPRP